ncbi:RNA-protein complex protein Nop10 [Candidatus Woesearchaeota archaeon]|nr:RNA-protein complex protein Nop10 [Candidatus Woesearchaeota archaeon]MBW3005232.1 RNA-protein complex protein Nop10 [Candidatus Woesearchaeota archaeon]
MKHILKCENCGAYTMKEKCKCKGKATTVVPAKYSPQDRYAEYRRKAKGLI